MSLSLGWLTIISLLIFYILVLAIIERGVLNSTIIVNLSISPISISFSFKALFEIQKHLGWLNPMH